MGFTRYIDIPTPPTDEQFDNIRNAIRRIIDAAMNDGIVICGWDGTSEPEFDQRIAFNGCKLMPGQSGETFSFSKNPNSWEKFCKTGQRPYDVVVAASYILIKWFMPDVKISGDGGPQTYIDGFRLAARVLGWNSDVSIPYGDGRFVIRREGVTEVVDG
jgi:hypothetical protein